jgi:hypothetical protein
LTIPGYLPLAGGTMSGAIAMGTFGITGLANPVNPQDAVTLNYITTALGSYLPLAGGTMSGAISMGNHQINNLLAPTSDTDASTKLYVDTVASGLAPAGAVDAATTTNFAATYNNGAAGVGATLTATSTGAVTLDGVAVTLTGDYLFKNQADNTQNGIYTCTTLGDVGVAAVFTRDNRYDTPEKINETGIVPVIGGSTQAGQGYYETSTIVAIGTTPIIYVNFGNSGTVTSITAGTGLTGGTITGSGTIALAVPVVAGNGGTGQTSLTAFNLILGNGTSAVNFLPPSATSGIPIISQGASANPVYGTAVVAGGGTGLATTTAYGLLAGGTTATGAFQNVGTGAAGTLLQGAGSAALPTFTTTTYPSTNAINTIMYASSANVLGVITPANSSVLVSGVTGIPAWSTTLPQFIAMTSPQITTSINDANNNQVFGISATPSAVNYIQAINSASTNPVALQALGTATNLILELQGKGTGGAAVQGTSTNDSAPAGYVGQIISAEVLIGSPVTISSNSATDIATLPLTAGQWDVYANIGVVGSTGTTLDTMIGCINTSTSINPASRRAFVAYGTSFPLGAGDIETVVPSQFFQLIGNTTIHLVIQSQFNVTSTIGAFGYIWAIRRR